jgi:hypothetical protein
MAVGNVTTDITTISGRSGARFDGIDDKLTVQNTFPIVWNNGGCISFNMFSLCPNTTNRIFDGTNINCLVNGSTNVISFTLAGQTTSTTGGDYISRKWTNVIINFDSAGRRIYINGALVKNDTTNKNLQSTDITSLYFGNRATGDRPFKGNVGNIKFYENVLESSEIIRLSNNEQITRGLFAEWIFKDNFNDTFARHNCTNSGAYLTFTDENVQNMLEDLRTNSNDKYLGTEINKQIFFAVIEEA